MAGSKKESSASPALSSGPYDSTANVVVLSIMAVIALQVLYRTALEAYKIRMYAIEEYGPVIHEFDPYFNYRATEYLYAHGWKAFSQWFDYMVWYPLGRPVGTTIYPGVSCLVSKVVVMLLFQPFQLTPWVACSFSDASHGGLYQEPHSQRLVHQ